LQVALTGDLPAHAFLSLYWKLLPGYLTSHSLLLVFLDLRSKDFILPHRRKNILFFPYQKRRSCYCTSVSNMATFRQTGGVMEIAVPELPRRFESLPSIVTDVICDFPPFLQRKGRILPLLGNVRFLPNPSQSIHKSQRHSSLHVHLPPLPPSPPKNHTTLRLKCEPLLMWPSCQI
jgi:hypothetical protein